MSPEYDEKLKEALQKHWTGSHLAPSFRLLDHSRYVIVARQSPAVQIGGYVLEVRSIPTRDRSPSNSSAPTSPASPTSPTSPISPSTSKSHSPETLIASYALPTLTYTRHLGMALSRVEVTSSITTDSFHPHAHPFISPAYPKILLFHFVMIGGGSPTQRQSPLRDSMLLNMVVLTNTFFPTPEQMRPYPDKIIPWSAWGPASTRCFLNKSIGVSVHMYRVCTSDLVMDFNPFPIERELCLRQSTIHPPSLSQTLSGLLFRNAKEDIDDDDIITQPTLIPKAAGIFTEEITSSLPFRITKHRIKMDAFTYPTIRLGETLVVTEGEKAVHSYL